MNTPATRIRFTRSTREERAERARVREERLRATAGIEGVAALSSWRGLSGRRYVVGIVPCAGLDDADLDGGVMIAVRRDPTGLARVVDVACAERARTEWLSAMIASGAEEIHMHRLAADEAARRAVAADLMDRA